MALGGCMHTVPFSCQSLTRSRALLLRNTSVQAEHRQGRDNQRQRQPPSAEENCSSKGFSRRGLLTGLVLAHTVLQANTPSQAGTCPAPLVQAEAALHEEAAAGTAHWCGASVHMLPQTGAAFSGTTAAPIGQHPSRAMPVADIAEIGEGTTRLVPSGQARLSLSERQVLEQNRRRQAQNSAPPDFPSFARQGFDIKILADGYSTSNGLIFKDFRVGEGDYPVDGQQVLFNYNAYNENGGKIDSSYNKKQPAQTRLGTKGLIPGFEQGIKEMKIGGRRRLVVPPELGPPVGPSTFFSAKQCEVFDVELLDIKNCRRRQVAMFSDVVCE
ncbi:hypothetical protein WJX74_010867 [Apatococcus lobatus]|uniref:peptidylprolyl isomerase n=1 Tax=Apatococcus lobatus TaxID=904363 RepID=A0AAW1QDI7_9CHLO